MDHLELDMLGSRGKTARQDGMVPILGLWPVYKAKRFPHGTRRTVDDQREGLLDVPHRALGCGSTHEEFAKRLQKSVAKSDVWAFAR